MTNVDVDVDARIKERVRRSSRPGQAMFRMNFVDLVVATLVSSPCTLTPHCKVATSCQTRLDSATHWRDGPAQPCSTCSSRLYRHRRCTSWYDATV